MIKIENISKSYGDSKVLDNFSLNIDTGDKVCIMGKSGVGKTTLINILLSLEKADSGSVTPLEKGSIGTVFQEDRLITALTPIKNILIANPHGTVENITTGLINMGLDPEDLVKPVGKLSGGMARRVAICRGIIGYNTIIMDEPFRGLDNQTKGLVMDYILREKSKASIIFVSHDITEADYLGARVVTLDNI